MDRRDVAEMERRLEETHGPIPPFDPHANKSGYVYFVREQDGPVKIGWTAKDPELRLRSMQTGNPRRLELLGTVRGTLATEAILHDRFSRYHLVGEWFDPAPELLSYIGAESGLTSESV